jgi:modulator of FtsH protease
MWNEFFVAIAGAAAALAGLIFVGVSINLTRILAFARLPDRALQAIILMLTILVISVLCLVPAQPGLLLGLELLAVGIITWVIVFGLDLRILRLTDKKYRNSFLRSMLLTEAAVLPYIVAGAVVLAEGSATGLYWVVPAVIVSFIKAVFDAWVLLVEINR